MRFTLTDAYLYLICLFPVMTTLTGGGIGNKVLFLLLLFLHLVLFFSRPVKRRTLTVLILLAGNYAFMLAFTDFPLRNYNLLAYYPFFLMYTCFSGDNGKMLLRWLSRHREFVLLVIVGWCGITGISMFLPGCYQIREGGKLYFGSFCKDIFRLGPSAVFVQILILLRMTLHEKKTSIVFMAVPMACYLMGSSRTYLVVGFFLLVIGWYLICGNRKLFWGTILPLSMAVLLLVCMSALGNKIAYTLDEGQYGDFWYRITSSRSYLWEQYLRAWWKTPLLNKLFGNHLEFTLAVAERWAHNDFLELLCSFGVLGVIQYCAVLRRLFATCWNGKSVPRLMRICTVMVWLFNALFNMHYVYFCAMLGYPLLVLALGEYYGRAKECAVPVQH